MAQLGSFFGKIEIEEHLNDDPQRHLAQLGGDIQFIAYMPAAHHVGGLDGHDLGVALYPLSVVCAIGGEQRGAYPHTEYGSHADAEGVGVLDQDVVGMLRAEGQGLAVEQVDRCSGAVGAMDTFDKGERIATELREFPNQGDARREGVRCRRRVRSRWSYGNVLSRFCRALLVFL